MKADLFVSSKNPRQEQTEEKTRVRQKQNKLYKNRSMTKNEKKIK